MYCPSTVVQSEDHLRNFVADFMAFLTFYISLLTDVQIERIMSAKYYLSQF